ncbi:MAG TPA: GPW/gp25 family protein [Synechococcales cyanobacterium M55_K2018_004]|nr:GPW/gp25 family protein [Synechococcales cyanobacterium M55_K2018_004]
MPENSQLRQDLRLRLKHAELRPVYTVAEQRRRLSNQLQQLTDWALVQGRDNLAQAIILRLLTPRGELAALGHPQYGSRLPELIGTRNTATNRNLIKLYILESLKQEPRIAQVEAIAVTADPVMRDRVNVVLSVLPIDSRIPLTIGPFALELAP